jgi:carbon starvation protein
VIWPLFGTTNQLLAALTLLVLSVFLLKQGRATIYTLTPFAFLLTMTIVALLIQLRTFWEQGNRFLAFLDVVILIATIWVALEAFAALQRARKEARRAPA